MPLLVAATIPQPWILVVWLFASGYARNGWCPSLGNRAIFNRMLGGYAPFLASYARYVKYPLPLGQPDSLTTSPFTFVEDALRSRKSSHGPKSAAGTRQLPASHPHCHRRPLPAQRAHCF